MDQNVIDVIAWTYSFHLSSMQVAILGQSFWSNLIDVA